MTHDKISCSVRMSRSLRMRICDSKLLQGAAVCFILICAFVAPAFAAEAKHGMVVTVHPLATDAAVKVLHDGGNAIDAAVAAGLTLGVVDGHNSGIGGGCFMLLRTADGKFYALDGRETAPAAASRDMYVVNGKADTELSQTGPRAVGIPGSVAVYEYALEHFGNKKLAEIIAPAADLAESGFAIDESYAKRLAATAPKIAQFAESKRILLKPDGSPYTAGEVLKQPDLGRTYRDIASSGSAYFYRGAFAKTLGEWMRANGGVVAESDFANYQTKLRDPLVTKYRGYTIVGFPPPSSGGVHVAEILNILANEDLASSDVARRVHLM